MLTLDDFDKIEATPARSGQRVIEMTPKKQTAGLEGLKISLFPTTWKRGDTTIWAWSWWTNRGRFDSSEGDVGGPPREDHFNVESAALAAIKSASYWSDDERLPRDEQERQERERKQKRLDDQINRFLNS